MAARGAGIGGSARRGLSWEGAHVDRLVWDEDLFDSSGDHPGTRWEDREWDVAERELEEENRLRHEPLEGPVSLLVKVFDDAGHLLKQIPADTMKVARTVMKAETVKGGYAEIRGPSGAFIESSREGGKS